MKSKGVLLSAAITVLAVKIIWDIIGQIRFGAGVTEGTFLLFVMVIVCSWSLWKVKHSN